MSRTAKQRDYPEKGVGKGPQLQGRVREYGVYGIFPFLVISGTVLGCNWSVRTYDCFEVGGLMSLSAFGPVVAVGTFALSFHSSSLLPKSSLHTDVCNSL